MTDLGQAGESLVAAWLQQKGWRILHQRWRAQRGEVDLIAHSPQNGVLAFVEVKTRSGGNWDQGGLLAVNSRKQAKLWQTANFFLVKYPQWAELTCRFDVAIVFSHGKVMESVDPEPSHLPANLQLGQTLTWRGYRLCLQNYLTDAFGGY